MKYNYFYLKHKFKLTMLTFLNLMRLILWLGLMLLFAAGCTAGGVNPTATTESPAVGGMPPVPTLNPQSVATGAEVYALHCASCHGVNLEGQPDWRTRNPDGSFRAPPHDDSGHTWHHPDWQLFLVTQQGSIELYNGNMPAFGEVLTDDEIHAVLDYIKSTWSPASRLSQWQVTLTNPPPPN